jgi:hypothetical protein
MAKIVGNTTTYHGTEHPYLCGLKVRIVAVMKGAAAPDHDPDHDGSYLRDEDEIARAGGVTAEDRVEVQPRVVRAGPTTKGDPMSTKKEIAKLTKMKLNELQAKFAEVTGETTRSPNKVFLIRRITEALQAADARRQRRRPRLPHPDATTEVTAQTEPASTDGKLTRLEVPELQARYLEVVGRPTGSTNKAYMIWKIREAQKGHIPVGRARTRTARASRSRCCPCAWRPRWSTSWTRPGARAASRTGWSSSVERSATTSSSWAPRTRLRCLPTLPPREWRHRDQVRSGISSGREGPRSHGHRDPGNPHLPR